MESKKYFITPSGEKLLTEWSDADFVKFSKKAERAAFGLLMDGDFEIIHGKREKTAAETFGLAYTSSSSFAAVWNTNTETRLRGTRLYFDGVAINDAGKPIIIYTELNKNGDEIGTIYSKTGLTLRAPLYAYGERA